MRQLYDFWEKKEARDENGKELFYSHEKEAVFRDLGLFLHVPKMYSGSVPLSLSAIQGSAKLNQLIDDAVGLAQSQKDKSLVYVKQCKWRNGEVILDSDNVAFYERGKNANGNLCFTFRGCDAEVAHLSVEATNECDELRQRVKELSTRGMCQQDIAKECGITQSKVSRLLNS